MNSTSYCLLIASIFLTLSLSIVAHAKKSDHEHVREAVKRGDIIPLRVILHRLDGEIQGKIIEIELDDDDEEWIYEIKVLRKNNKVVKFEIDAKTGRIIKVKQRDKR